MPQTQMTFKFGDEILPRAYGFPMKIRVPTKLGFKNPKYVMSMEVTNDYKGGFWEDQGYNSFSGSLPRVEHRRVGKAKRAHHRQRARSWRARRKSPLPPYHSVRNFR